MKALATGRNSLLHSAFSGVIHIAEIFSGMPMRFLVLISDFTAQGVQVKC